MKNIKIRTSKPEDLQEIVYFLTPIGLSEETRYGEVGEGPYILRSDTFKRERNHNDRVEFVEQRQLDIYFIKVDGEYPSSGWRAASRTDVLFPLETVFDSWASCVDALMDMEEI